jgi:5-methylcytosine-specific restriction endonuclease McrA
MAHQKQRKAGWRRQLRERLAEAQNWRCCYCGLRLEPETATLEHVVPYGQGGMTSWDNCVVACSPCNHAVGDFDPRRTARQQASMVGHDFRPTFADIWPK